MKLMNPLSRRGKDAGAARSPSPLKARVERLEGLTVVGWARNPSSDLAGERIELRLDGRVLPEATVRRLERADVAAALACERLDLGFEIEVPPALWESTGAPRGRVDVIVDGQPVDGPAMQLTGLSLAGLVSDALALEDDAQRLAVLSRLRTHVERGGLWPLLDEHGAEALRRTPCFSGGPALRAFLEQPGPLRLVGWAVDLARGHERFELRCNGHVLDAQPLRLERRDVAEALGVERLDLGFEIDVPGHAWDGLPAGAVCSLELRVNGQPLQERPLVLQRADLVRLVQQHCRLHEDTETEAARLVAEEQAEQAAQKQAEEQAEQAARKPAEEQAGQVPQGQAAAKAVQRARLEARARVKQAQAELAYQGLLLIEHVACARLLGELPSAAALQLRALAAQSGLGEYLVSSATAASPPLAADVDVRTLLEWEAQRRFNEVVAADGRNAIEALEQVLNETRLQGERRQRLLISLTPFMCRVGAFQAFRPWLDARVLEGAEGSTNAWEASLALPFLVHAGQWPRAAAVLQRIAQRPDQGWLNTECVLEAVRLGCAAHAGGRAGDEDLESLAHALCALLDACQGGYWSRLHDQNLVRALAALLGHAAFCSDVLRKQLVASALRHYGLVPSFWSACEAAYVPGEVDGEMDAARRAFDAIAQRLREPRPLELDDLGPLLEALAGFRRHGNPDVAIFEREILIAAAPDAAAGGAARQERLVRLAELQDASETVRLASLPLPQGNPLAPHVPALAERLRALTNIPKSAQYRLQCQAAALLAQLERAVAAGDAAQAAPALSAFERLVPALCTPRAQFLGFALVVAAYELACTLLPQAAALLASLHDLLDRAVDDAVSHARRLPAAVTGGLGRLAALQQRRPEPLLAAFLSNVRARALPGVTDADTESPLLLPEGRALQLRSTHPVHDLLVVVYSCRPYLDTRVPAMRRTWLSDLQAAGIPYVVLVGGAEQDRLHGDVLELAVSDRYEDLPAKTLHLLQWVHAHTDVQHVLKIDDDCYLDVERYFGSLSWRKHHYYGRVLRRAPGGHDRLWHQQKAATRGGQRSIDKSPEGSVYADGGGAYCLSRHAITQLLAVLRSRPGADLVRGSIMEDKLVGDLLARAGIEPSNEDYEVQIRRRTFGDALPVNMYDNTFYPGRYSPTKMVHLDTHLDMERVHREARREELTPHKLWPTYGAPQLIGAQPTNQLELLSPVERLGLIRRAPFLVVAVMRNEKVMLPHFLAHYRRLGAECFVIVDNLSTDGTREQLLAQPDVVLYSADTPYRDSHFGVSWQQAVLGNHALGKWALVADADELIVYEGCEQRPLTALIGEAEAEGADAVRLLMIDMYPQGPLQEADFDGRDVFEVASWFDRQPLIHWKLGSGAYSNAPALLSALRHRLIPHSAPNLFTSQKVALFRYQPWTRFSEGLHFASGLRVARRDACFAHFKYHAAFQQKAAEEIARKQHFNGAEEYRKYQAMVAESCGMLHSAQVSTRYAGSDSFSALKYDAAL